MKTVQKIAKVLEVKGISPSKAERLIGVSQGTLTKAIERNGSVHDSTQEKFTRYFHVKPQWWESGTGEIFDENPTRVKESGKKEDDLLDHPLVKSMRSELEALRELLELYKKEITRLGGK